MSVEQGDVSIPGRLLPAHGLFYYVVMLGDQILPKTTE